MKDGGRRGRERWKMLAAGFERGAGPRFKACRRAPEAGTVRKQRSLQGFQKERSPADTFILAHGDRAGLLTPTAAV